MAVTAFDGGYKMTAGPGDILDNATVGDGSSNPFRCRINKIHLVRDGTAGATTTVLKEGGSSGNIIVRGAPGTNDTVVIHLDGQDVSDLALVSITEGTVVYVFVE